MVYVNPVTTYTDYFCTELPVADGRRPITKSTQSQMKRCLLHKKAALQTMYRQGAVILRASTRSSRLSSTERATGGSEEPSGCPAETMVSGFEDGGGSGERASALIPCRRDVTRLRRSSGARQEGPKIAAHAGQVPNRGLEAAAPRSFVSSSAAVAALAAVANVTRREVQDDSHLVDPAVPISFLSLQARIRFTHRAVTGPGFTA